MLSVVPLSWKYRDMSFDSFSDDKNIIIIANLAYFTSHKYYNSNLSNTDAKITALCKDDDDVAYAFKLCTLVMPFALKFNKESHSRHYDFDYEMNKLNVLLGMTKFVDDVQETNYYNQLYEIVMAIGKATCDHKVVNSSAYPITLNIVNGCGKAYVGK